jgi:CxxC-x17-CxxC domain-containing protein
MKSFGRDKKFGDRPNFGKPRFGGGGRDFDRPTMTQATCAKCGKSCEVPFKPNGRKPVYCSDCFRKEDNDYNGGYERKSFDRPAPERQPDPRPMYNELASVNAKLDKILKILNPEIK